MQIEPIEIDGKIIDVRVRSSARAKRLQASLSPLQDVLTITVPHQAQNADIEECLVQAKAWVAGKLRDDLAPVPLVAGATIPVFGEPHKISFEVAKLREVTWLPKEIRVKGFAPVIVSNQVTGALCDKLYGEIQPVCKGYSRQLNCRIGQVSLKDTKRQWGSSSSNGNLSFSWRLIFAPREVAYYVCLHEVCHQLEMNHSPRFWALVESLMPDYKESVQWLKNNGRKLHTYGAN